MTVAKQTTVIPFTYPCRHDWQLTEVLALFALPFNELIYQAQTAHRAYFDPQQVQLSSLLNIKTGKCPEDCAYCPQSGHYDTGLQKENLMSVTDIVERAQQAKANGASRFCMGAAWRHPNDQDFQQILTIVQAVKATGLETCLTIGMLSAQQAEQLKTAGLDYYNHNLDTSEAFYPQIITTHSYQSRLTTLQHIRRAGIHICCGGIIGLGENLTDRAELLQTLANLPQHPESVPINQLVQVAGTPLADAPKVDAFDFVRCIAVARLLMPASAIRLSAGRNNMNEALQALCFLAGANSIFYGEKLLTTPNPENNQDLQLLERLGLQPV